jgi:hypothetical protein
MNAPPTGTGNLVPNPDSLIFPWDKRPPRRVLRLVMVLFFSLLLHAFSFYVLQVAYTPTASLSPPPAQVVLLPPASPENIALSHWLTMADPALMTQSSRLTTAQVLEALRFRYVPSYVAKPPAFKSLDSPLEGDAALPRASPFGPAPMPPLSAGNQPPRPVNGPASSRLTFTGNLGALLAVDPLPPIRFTVRSDGQNPAPLEPAVFLVGVPAGGGAPFLFRKSSSGNAAADEFARQYLSGLRFQPPTDPASPTWEWAAFHWGEEVYR